MKSKISKVLILTTICLVSFFAPAMAAGFNMKSYLGKAQGDEIYPTAAQIEMLEKVIPEDTYAPFPAITDRKYWGDIAKSKEGKAYLAEALELITAEPEVPISDEIYRRANLEGNRGIYKPRYYSTMDKLERFLIAECIQNEGKFLAQIETFSRAIMAMKSWVHPNHDDKENGVLEGRRVTIDLGARKFGFILALTEITLTDKLSSELRAEILRQIRYRITDSYLNSCSGKTPNDNKWITAKSNWNSVCTSGTLLTIMTTSQDRAERIVAMGCALNSMKHYMSGFGEDGYCSEGLGYWNYGFGHYLYLAEIFYDYSDGKIDLFKFDNPDKMVAVGNFPANYEIHNKWYAPFSDGVTSVGEGNDNFAYLMSAKHYGAKKPTYFKPDESVFTIIGWRDADKYTAKKDKTELPPVTYFDDCGIVISRGIQKTPFSVAIKAGHNAENHNHNDVGSYFIRLGNDLVAGDIGAPSYVAGAFSPSNPARSSWGHPVPRINNTLQSSGAEFKGKVTKTKFEDKKDFAKLDILPAYELPMIKKLERTLENDKGGKGKITVTDSFEASEAVIFGTAVMVNVEYEIKDNTIILNTGDHRVKVEIKAKGGDIVIKDEVVPVEKLRSGRTSYRIGVDFTQPVKKGSIEVVYKPM
ncbi:MAG: heparinase II/III family protein [Rikenellaceae bacterium]